MKVFFVLFIFISVVEGALAAQASPAKAVEEALLGLRIGMPAGEAKKMLPGSECSNDKGEEVCEKNGPNRASWLGTAERITFRGSSSIRFITVTYPTDAELLTALIGHLKVLLSLN